MENLTNVLVDLKEEEVKRIIKEKIKAGEDPIKILESCRVGMTVVGDRFEKGEYFLPELLMAGEIFKEAVELVKPTLIKPVQCIGRVVIGTVKGDVHDIGKNIVTSMLDGAGFEVHDIGIDASPEKFVEKTKEVNPQIVGMSGLITLSIESMKKTVDAIRAAGLRDKVKIILGGAPTDEIVCRYVEADAWADDAVRGVRLCKEFIKEMIL